ncbi:MAG: FkbM family methyltransferase [Bacteroidetes bacterium]|nr:FkbM family methyltransferase [Bacteroidota bacterium]
MLLLYLRKFPLDYGKKYVARWVRFNPEKTRVTYSNSHSITFDLDLNEYQMKQIYLYDIYEKNTVRQLFKLIDKRKSKDLVVFDVGANIGFYSLTLSKKLNGTSSRIHAFEPNPHTFGILEKNVSTNNGDNIVLNQMGLSDKPGTLTISYDFKNLGAANIFNGSGKNSAEVSLTTLDEYCTSKGISTIDIIKVDIEGSELNFLKGGTAVIERSKNLIVVMEIVEENCTRAGYTSQDLLDFMVSRGFKVYLPKPWPFKLRQIGAGTRNFQDNLIFIKS